MCKGHLDEIRDEEQVVNLISEVTQQAASSEYVEAALDWVLGAALRSRFNMYIDLATIITQLRLSVSVDQADLAESLRIHDLPPYPDGVKNEKLTPAVLELLKHSDQLKEVIGLLPSDL